MQIRTPPRDTAWRCGCSRSTRPGGSLARKGNGRRGRACPVPLSKLRKPPRATTRVAPTSCHDPIRGSFHPGTGLRTSGNGPNTASRRGRPQGSPLRNVMIRFDAMGFHPGTGLVGNDGLVPSRCPNTASRRGRPQGSPLRNVMIRFDAMEVSTPGPGCGRPGTTVGDGLVPSRCPSSASRRGRPQGSPLRNVMIRFDAMEVSTPGPGCGRPGTTVGDGLVPKHRKPAAGDHKGRELS